MTYIPILFTKDGLEKLQTDYEKLLQKRKEVVERLSRAREMGDLSENAAYKGARLELSMTDSRLRKMLITIKRAKIIEKKQSNYVEIGSSVTLFDGQNTREFTIVGSHESNPSEGKISYLSPIGSKLLGKKTGEQIKIVTPQVQTVYTIQKVK